MKQLIGEFVEKQRPSETVVLENRADGFLMSANTLPILLQQRLGQEVRVVELPPGIPDFASWRRQGATLGDVAAAIDAVGVSGEEESNARR
jgi:hypothetical protein